MFDLIAPVFLENWTAPVVVLHVIAAVSAILVGLIPMIARKGGMLHNRAGLAYFWLMMFVCASGALLLFEVFNFFLAMITLFSGYAAFTGYRVLFRKKKPAGLIDWVGTFISLAGGAAFMGWGILSLLGMIRGLPTAFALLGVGFGLFLVNDAFQDVRAYRNPPTDKRWWFFYHMDRMLGSYIALITALSVQTISPRLPVSIAWVVWIAPGVIGGFLISRWIRSYRQQFESQAKHNRPDVVTR